MLNEKLTTTKWRPVIESFFIEHKYLLPYITTPIAMEIENNYNNGCVESHMKKIRELILNDIGDGYYMNIKTLLNPFTSEIVYWYNDDVLNKDEIQKATIENHLQKIDFYNIIKFK